MVATGSLPSTLCHLLTLPIPQLPPLPAAAGCGLCNGPRVMREVVSPPFPSLSIVQLSRPQVAEKALEGCTVVGDGVATLGRMYWETQVMPPLALLLPLLLCLPPALLLLLLLCLPLALLLPLLCFPLALLLPLLLCLPLALLLPLLLCLPLPLGLSLPLLIPHVVSPLRISGCQV